MNVLSGIILLLGAAAFMVLAQIHTVSWFAVLLTLLVLVPAGLALIFGADDKARALLAKWWSRCKEWFAGKGGWSLWEAVFVGILIFGILAGKEFLVQPLLIMAGILAPWLAGLWAAKRGTQWPVSFLSTLAGAVVGMVEGRFFLNWLPTEWRDFPSWLLIIVVAGLIGAALGFWACARGQLKLGGQAEEKK